MDVTQMFKGIVESKSHEGGLLATFTGSSPALGSIIVTTDDGTYIGKIDAVLGNTDNPLAHIAHLDRKMNPDRFLGSEVQIRPKAPRSESSHRNGNSRHDRNRDGRSNNRDRYERTNDREQNRSNWRENRRDNDGYKRRDSSRRNFTDRDSNRRDSRRDNSRGIDFNRRDSRDSRPRGRDSNQRDSRSRGRENKIFADNDWTCKKCNNVNFSFRKECNRCGEPKDGNSRDNQGRQRDSRQRQNQSRQSQSRHNDGQPRKFRKAKGKSANHAHNKAPKPLNARSRKRNRDN